MSKLVVREPDKPLYGRRRAAKDTEWFSLLEPAKKRPGRWHEVEPSYASPGAAATAAYDINEGRKELPSGNWEACSRTRVDGNGTPVGVLFVRFLGD